MLDHLTRSKLNDWAKKALKIRKKLSLGTHSLTPINYDEERETFLSSKTYNPQFYYNPKHLEDTDQQIYDLIEEFKTLDLPKDLKTYLESYLENLEILDLTNKNIGTDSFNTYATKLFNWKITPPKESPNELDFSNQKIPKGLYDATRIQETFKEALTTLYNMPDFLVDTDDFNSITIRVTSKKVIIGSSVKRNELNLKRLIVHEIESHALQQHNLRNLNCPLLELIRFDDSALYGEGLAVYNEVQTNTMTQKAYDTYYYRLKAVNMLSRSFREIYKYLLNFIPSYNAFMITYRVKRGLSDTSQPGGFLKDASYLLGYYTVKEYVEKRGGSLKSLYISRVPKLLQLLQKHKLLTIDAYIFPSFLHEETP